MQSCPPVAPDPGGCDGPDPSALDALQRFERLPVPTWASRTLLGMAERMLTLTPNGAPLASEIAADPVFGQIP